MTMARARGFDPRWLPLGVTTIGSFMSIIDTNIVNIALPSILSDFNASLTDGQLVIASYLIALAVVIPLTGYLSERVGMKRLYMITLGFFTLGSALCGLAWNEETLILFRVMQGLGGGMIMPLGMALVFTMIRPLERPRFMALLGIPQLLAPMIGPSLGGYIVEYSSWRMVFLINAPLGAIDIVLAYFLLKETEIKPNVQFDFRGFALAATAFPCLLLALSLGTENGWESPLVLGLLTVGAIALAGFIWVELNQKAPMLTLRLFKDNMFRLSQFIQWIGLFSLFGLNFLIPLYLQRVHGMGAAEAGRVLLPMGIVAFITMNVAGRMYHRLGPRPIIVTGLAVVAITTFLWSLVTPTTSTFTMMVLVSARGLALGMFGQTVQLVAYNTVPKDEMARATGLVNVCQRIASAAATAILTSILLMGLTIAGAPEGSSIADGTAPVETMEQAFHYAFYIMTAMSIVGIGLALRIHDRVLNEEKEKTRVAAEAGDSPYGRKPGEPIISPQAAATNGHNGHANGNGAKHAATNGSSQLETLEHEVPVPEPVPASRDRG